MPLSPPDTSSLSQAPANAPAALADFDPSRLADIHLPESVSFWPIAAGWWIVLVLFIASILLLLLLKKFNSRSKKNRPANIRKLAKKELQLISREYQMNHDALETVKRVSIFLRRYVLSLTERQTVASLTDEQWLQYLDQLSNATFPVNNLFSQRYATLLKAGPYQRKLDAEKTMQVDQLLLDVKHLVSSEQTSPGGIQPSASHPHYLKPEVIDV